jgi:hypothetical protein
VPWQALQAFAANPAVTVRLEVGFDTVHTSPEADVQPPQPVNLDIASGVAVRAMLPLTATASTQSPVPG